MLSVLRKLNYILETSQKKKIVLLMLLMLLGAFFEMMGVSMMLPIVSVIMQPDIIEKNVIIEKICLFLNIHSHRTFVILCIIILIFIYIIKDLFLVFEYNIQYKFLYNCRFDMQKKLMGIFLNQPYEYYLNVQSADVQKMILTDTHGAFYSLLMLLSLSTEGMAAIFLLATVLVIDPVMTLGVLVSMGLAVIVIAKIIKPTLKKEGKNYEVHESLTRKWLNQAVWGIKDVKIARKELFFWNNYKQCGECMINAERKRDLYENLPRLLIEMVCVSSVLTLIAISLYQGRAVESLLPALGAFAMAAVRLMPAANRVVTALNAVTYYEPSVNRMYENIRNMKENPGKNSMGFESDGTMKKEDEKTSQLPSLSLTKQAELKEVSFTYPGSEKPVLVESNMIIPVGTSVGIVGASGSGKTTAVDIVLGLLMPQEGKVLTDGVDIQTNYADWLAHVAYIPQNIFLLDDTIRANVAFGVSEEKIDDKRIWYALEEAQVADFVKELPDGIYSQIGENGKRISGGQQQRLGIARALYLNPELLVFDEATSALDNDTESMIMDSINSLHGKKTMIIIAHRLQTIEGCDIVYRVADGKIERER